MRGICKNLWSFSAVVALKTMGLICSDNKQAILLVTLRLAARPFWDLWVFLQDPWVQCQSNDPQQR